ncbi:MULTISPECIES: ABC transporter ATP-binding protein [unclassified Sulfuricurvum]|uniref:cell division ATP-binding protein FtsE n=1 Tax=unclassified Sulfuricurvum TaxID=2632390 RepID=UPI0002997C69|nr:MULTISPECIES: ABC transporter ATP-binding protein [unclassified Sulfuricurvum]OHD83432.1 MAG: ABC transporter ATP-binding protein [Sulfuricurvum sp. RIFCSPHIGHO2_02_FULL_43_9]OHD85880.1 MAG: ABC transporter ATP-binding protein [Sulfuricurvum sp. RIFCSPLOWO2_02_FULL_43_45]OHD86257.1 MAG: ABC transporter ATP-binding protein [Sulfuricurvum sp. RIFCSPLOWO2_02_43_6]AFV97088.1 ABC transporter-like protein [Candidatus Sulfuricurvum sp. RIFRC-1]OHD89256.1 MAG: ABC transporter ATP-binding protein [S
MDKVIIAENLSLSYKEFETIISKANFSIDAGSFVFITGASGSGKSTLLKSFYGAIEPRAGQLMVGGVKMSRISTSKLNFLRRHIGIVFQDYKLIKEWTIEKNVMLPLIISGYTKDVSSTQVQKLLGHVKLIHQSGKYPPELSGGEQQRVAMARALAHNPILILADEPTGNLDEYSSQVIWNLLEGANTQLKTTVVVVTHNIPNTINIPYKHYHIEMGNIHEVS